LIKKLTTFSYIENQKVAEIKIANNNSEISYKDL